LHEYLAELPSSEISERYKESLSIYNDVTETAHVNAMMYFVNDDTYKAYVKQLHLNPERYDGSAAETIAIARVNRYNYDTGRYDEYDILKNDEPQKFTLRGRGITADTAESGDSVELTVTHFTEYMPEDIAEETDYDLLFIVPISAKNQFFIDDGYEDDTTMTFLSDAPKKSEEAMAMIVRSELTGGVVNSYSLYNAAELQENNRNILLILDVFTYGFIILISLITIANVFNTISTNINLRRREFAMLKSVGMTDKGFNRMMSFECVLYGLKALIYGLPTAFIITYFIYQAVMEGVDVPFMMPWTSVAISTFSVFFVVFVTMLYSISKVKKENTVDALKNDVL
jgi:putative ABC transport system permease protein